MQNLLLWRFSILPQRQDFIKIMYRPFDPIACLKIAFCHLRVTVCGRFCPNERNAAGYVDRMKAKSTAKWSVYLAEMNFRTRSGTILGTIVYQAANFYGNVTLKKFPIYIILLRYPRPLRPTAQRLFSTIFFVLIQAGHTPIAAGDI